MSRRAALAVILLSLLATPLAADESANRVAELEARITALEARLAQLEQRLAAATAMDPQALKARGRAAFNRRTAADLQRYSREQLSEAERLYQTANKDWRSPEAGAALREMVERFPDINRTGCAVLYLGQMAEGEEKVALLQQVIEKYPDCYYGDGTQTGPYAMYLLATHHLAAGHPELAQPLVDRIRKDHPTAIGHRGELLAQSLPESTVEPRADSPRTPGNSGSDGSQQ